MGFVSLCLVFPILLFAGTIVSSVNLARVNELSAKNASADFYVWPCDCQIVGRSARADYDKTLMTCDLKYQYEFVAPDPTACSSSASPNLTSAEEEHRIAGGGSIKSQCKLTPEREASNPPAFELGQTTICWAPRRDSSLPDLSAYSCANDDCIKILDPAVTLEDKLAESERVFVHGCIVLGCALLVLALTCAAAVYYEMSSRPCCEGTAYCARSFFACYWHKDFCPSGGLCGMDAVWPCEQKSYERREERIESRRKARREARQAAQIEVGQGESAGESDKGPQV